MRLGLSILRASTAALAEPATITSWAKQFHTIDREVQMADYRSEHGRR